MHAALQPSIDYPTTWYADTRTDVGLRTPLATGKSSVDYCVVGAGLAGLSTALELVRRGAKVAVLEAGRIAWGASGRNGGFVSNGFATDLDPFVEKIGKDCAHRLYQYSIDGANYVRDNIQKLSPQSLMGEEKYSLNRYPDAQNTRRYVENHQREFNEPFEYLSRQQIQTVLKTDRYYDGVLKKRGFHIHPLNYALALAGEIERLGGVVYEDSKAVGLVNDPVGMTVMTKQGQISCQKVIICTSGYDQGFYKPVSDAVLPVATHVVVTAPLNSSQSQFIGTKSAIADTSNACDYYRLIDDNRLLWGGKITTMRSPPGALNEQMSRAITDVYPGLANIGIDYSWSGLMGYCRHKMPVIREHTPGVWVVTAFGGHGLNTTAMAGVLVADALINKDQRWKDFDHFNLSMGAGVFGQAVVQGSYWWMQLKDWINESRAR